jgi:biopolymer transport protein ExbD
MNLRGGRHRDEPEINFIPLIDVLLVILIFLMVTTTYQRVGLKITLPEANADPMQQRPKESNVGISAQGQYMVDRTRMPFAPVGALAEGLSRAAAGAKDPVIIINADANATHQSVIHVMEAARQAGLVHITFATQTTGK